MPQDVPTAYDAFISYSTRNKNVADALCHYLEERKIRCWMAPRDIRPGQEYAEIIEHAISNVKVFILVYSNDSSSSQWVKKETNLAVAANKMIIPFRIENCPLQGAMKTYLIDLHWIDAIPHPDREFGRLAETLLAFLKTSSEKGESASSGQWSETVQGTMHSDGAAQDASIDADEPDAAETGTDERSRSPSLAAKVFAAFWLIVGLLLSAGLLVSTEANVTMGWVEIAVVFLLFFCIPAGYLSGKFPRLFPSGRAAGSASKKDGQGCFRPVIRFLAGVWFFLGTFAYVGMRCPNDPETAPKSIPEAAALFLVLFWLPDALLSGRLSRIMRLPFSKR